MTEGRRPREEGQEEKGQEVTPRLRRAFSFGGGRQSTAAAQAHGIELVEVQRQFKDGRDSSLYQYVLKEQRGISIPMRMEGSGSPGHRKCTTAWKIEVIAKYLHQRGWQLPWVQMMGIAWDESHRMRDEDDPQGYHRAYPLCEMRL